MSFCSAVRCTGWPTPCCVSPRLPAKDWNPSPAGLSLAERKEIRVGLERGDSLSGIAVVR